MKYRIISVTEFKQNCSLVWCESTHEGALIDPGGDANKILRIVKKQAVRLKKILLTHGHIDHVGAARLIADKLQIPIIGPHKDDKYWLELLPKEAREFSMPRLDKLEPNRWLSDGSRIKIGNKYLSTLHCPGHTPGHVVFYQKKSKVAFVGDVIFKNSIGRTDFPGGCHQTLMQSINNKLLPLGDSFSFIPGHGPVSTLGKERQNNPFLI